MPNRGYCRTSRERRESWAFIFVDERMNYIIRDFLLAAREISFHAASGSVFGSSDDATPESEHPKQEFVYR